MSLATLARKTKAKQRLRTRGNFILNMTGRGHVLGMNAKMSRGNCKGLTKCAGKRAACCVGVPPPLPCLLPPLNNQDSNMTVGTATGGRYGAEVGSFGTFDPIIDIGGYGIQMIWFNTTVKNFRVNFFGLGGVAPSVGSPPDNLFSSISFINCDDHTIRTYLTANAMFVPSTGTPGEWSWNFTGAGLANELAYWSSQPGKTLKVYFDNVPNPNDICCPQVQQCCRFKHGGKPAPQMGYRVYLNRKSKGAYRPGGGPQCCTNPDATSGKIVWKQGSNLDASVVITNKKDNVLACNSDVYTAKRDTCTGCTTTGNFTVGKWGNDDTQLYGYINHDEEKYGAFVPPIINGNAVLGLFYTNTGEADSGFALVVAGYPGETMFSSISFVNCEEKTVRTYYQGAHGGYAAAEFNTDANPDLSFWIWHTASSGFSIADELTYWQGAAGKKLQVYIDNPNPPLTCPQCCCPVKKNICGCRATDLLRYTRINKSFGCQTTKAIRQSRTASEQIARNRAKVDCIKPMHRTIFINVNADGNMSFNGCCGDQCLIPGQQYTFYVTDARVETDDVLIAWCKPFPSNLIGALTDIIPSNSSVTLTVPKFNTNSNCTVPTQAYLLTFVPNEELTLDYCKQAFKKPQMLGSCSGR